MLKRKQIGLAITAVLATHYSLSFAQTAEEGEKMIEEVVVTGSQIKGANISEALAVSVIDSAEIEVMGIDSGDELLDLIPENGQNLFSEAENISGGVNSARGDIGAFNLRNIGTGNTLVLLNGRRLVNAASWIKCVSWLARPCPPVPLGYPRAFTTRREAMPIRRSWFSSPR
jgi:outer membrane receptor for ferrienterochelin and colicin